MQVGALAHYAGVLIQWRQQAGKHVHRSEGRRPWQRHWPRRSGTRTWCERVTAKVRVLRAEFGYVPEDPPGSTRAAAMGADVVTVPGVGHHLHVERPERVAAEVLSMLEGI